MREIKFRAWDKFNKKLIYIQGFIKDGNSIRIWYFNGNDDECVLFNELFDVTGIIINQFTGLKDKNGKDIYECDIVKIMDSSYGTYLSTIKYENYLSGFIVGTAYGIACNKQLEMPNRKWDEKHMPCQCDGAMYHGRILLHVKDCLTELNENIEVVGNIHENLELLK